MRVRARDSFVTGLDIEKIDHLRNIDNFKLFVGGKAYNSHYSLFISSKKECDVVFKQVYKDIMLVFKYNEQVGMIAEGERVKYGFGIEYQL